MKSKVVCAAIDDRYLWPWIVSIYSGYQNSESTIFLVTLLNINSSISKKNLILIAQIFKELGIGLKIVEVESEFQPEFSNSKKLVVYGPLFALDLMEQDFVWLDADLILLPGWTKIFSETGENFKSDTIICASMDTNSTLQILRNAKSQSYEKNKERYFNSGVMIASPQNWKKKFSNLEWQGIALRRRDLNFLFNDQDVLNFMVGEGVSLINSEFNKIAGTRLRFSDGKIIHFAGSPKPWQMSPKARHLYLTYLSMRFSNFSENSSIVDYSLYWSYENDLLNYFQRENHEIYRDLNTIREHEGLKLDLFASLKHRLLLFLSKDFRK